MSTLTASTDGCHPGKGSSPTSDAGTAEERRFSSTWLPHWLGATITIEEEVAAANEARQADRPGFTVFVDGSRLENGTTGYTVAWKKGQTWKGHQTHMGWGQEANDAECARALRAAATGIMRQARQPSSQTRRRPPGGWPPTTPGQDKNTRSRPGKTSPPSAPKNPMSGSRSGGAQATKALKATR